jgi:uncharacterized membrane protein
MRIVGLVLLVPLAACVRHRSIAEQAAAMREGLGDYRVIEIIAEMGGEESTTWAAHYDDAGNIRYVRERSREEGTIASDREFWFEERKLFAYLSRVTPSPGAEEVVVYLGFDRAGGLAEQSKTVGGIPERVLATEVAAAKDRGAFLERGAARALTRPTSVTAPVFTTTPAHPGSLRLEDGKLRFLACGEGAHGVLIDDLPDERGAVLLRELGGQGAVLVRLDEDRLREIRYAAAEGSTCDRRRREGDVLAVGNEPFWSIRVDGGDALLRTPEEPDGVVFRDGTWSHSGDGPWVFRARRGSPAGVEHLTMELTEARCVDSMSGARFPMKAAVTRERQRLDGCAVEGAGRGKAEAR